MLDNILSMLMLSAVILPCCGWAYVWVRTYRGQTAGALILHTVIFLALSLLIVRIAGSLLFSQADESWSASNNSALGLLYLMLLSVFSIACLIAFFQTVGDTVTRRRETQDEKEQKQ